MPHWMKSVKYHYIDSYGTVFGCGIKIEDQDACFIRYRCFRHLIIRESECVRPVQSGFYRC